MKKAKAEAKPSINRLRRVKKAAATGSDERFRAELKAAINDLLKHKTLKVSVKPVGTVWKGRVIDGNQEAQLKKALAAVDAQIAGNRTAS